MIGIVILNYNTPNDVLNCVKSIIEHTKSEYKIIIVDNGSNDSSYECFIENYSKLEQIYIYKTNKNLGFSGGNNVGINHAIELGCDYICLINADILLLNDAITILKNKIEANQDIGLSAPSIVSPNSNIETQFARNKLTYANFLAEKSFLKKSKSFVKKHPRYQIENKNFDSDYIFYGMTYGCMYVLKSSFLIKTKYLDADVFLFNEEDILAYKLENEGLYTLITPDAKVVHNHHSSITKTSVANRVFHFRVSELIVLRKYAAVSIFKLLPIVITFDLVWIIKSIFSKDFRNKLGSYLKKNHQILKIKKGIGLKY